MKILRPRTHHEHTTYSLFFERRACHGAGWAPNCDENGVVDPSKMPPASYATWLEVKPRLDKIRANQDEEFFPPVVQSYTNRYWEPAVGECNRCKREVELYGFTNTCECGRDYNQAGSELAPREQWGEETGESLSDILRIQ